MIVGIGVDTVKISDIEEALKIPNFKETTFTANEIKNEHGNLVEYYATRFACKEAVYKALGKPEDWRLIETLNNEDGNPYVNNQEYSNYKVMISITTVDKLATVFCVVETNQ